ncbi:hypothetical protein ACFL3S_13595, partial [Gemmatimonadota bacterium]
GHRSVETEKIEFWRADDFDVSRTRVTDEVAGIQHDRVVTWLKEENVFVVFDIMKVLETGYYTFATLWHSTTILDEGEDYFVTAVDFIRGQPQHQGKALRIEMPQTGIRSQGSFDIRRNNEDNLTVYETLASHYLEGHVETFVTVLSPVPREDIAASAVEAIQVLESPEERAGIGVLLQIGGEEIFVGAKTDLDYGILAANKRPRYTFASGRVGYGPFATDANFFFARIADGALTWGGTNLVGMRYQDQDLFSARRNTFTLEPDDWATGLGAGKWRYWEGIAEVRR